MVLEKVSTKHKCKLMLWSFLYLETWFLAGKSSCFISSHITSIVPPSVYTLKSSFISSLFNREIWTPFGTGAPNFLKNLVFFFNVHKANGESYSGKTLTLSQPLHQVHRLTDTVGIFNPMRIARTIWGCFGGNSMRKEMLLGRWANRIDAY